MNDENLKEVQTLTKNMLTRILSKEIEDNDNSGDLEESKS